MHKLFFFTLIYWSTIICACTKENERSIQPGAHNTDAYLNTLAGKNVSLVVNQTSTINKTHLVDSLLTLNIRLVNIFAPEHGFRGTADAGEHVKSGIDTKTGLPIVSLYGKNKKPSKAQLEKSDILIFDIQDVGCRFYTYLSTLHYIMEACAENHIPLILLDRPNPNGHYTAGPVLQQPFKSFVGMHPIPIVHGCTLGEMAQMIKGERWINNAEELELEIIKVSNYTHKTPYTLPIAPSPNLPNIQSIYLYPSLCLFEPTLVSIGRGTPFPFQVYGYPKNTKGTFEFTPISMPGKSKYPKHENTKCLGYDLRNISPHPFSLSMICSIYEQYSGKADFFTNPKFFNLLVGNNWVIKDLKDKVPYNEIEHKWQAELESYNLLRSKYLLYP